MALPLVVHKRFAKNAEAIYFFLRREWDHATADRFLNILEARLTSVVQNPSVGAPSQHLVGVRSLSVTKHSRLFYKIYPDRIAMLYLKDTRRRRYRR